MTVFPRYRAQYQCKNLKREEVKQWLHDMLKLLNQKSDQNLESEKKRLEALHQRHVEMLPGIEENMRKVGENYIDRYTNAGGEVIGEGYIHRLDGIWWKFMSECS